MKRESTHLSDQQILMDVDAELSAAEEKTTRAHLDACWTCRVRRQEIEAAIADFVRVYQTDRDQSLPPMVGPRALLKARLAELSARPVPPSAGFLLKRVWALAAAVCGALAIGFLHTRSDRGHGSMAALAVSVPDATLTPGAALLVSRGALCAQDVLRTQKNKAVPDALQKKVFEEYGISGAEPRAYEVDYLITPALGGADDIHNLWPHSHRYTVWNARVKDALEDRLRDLVCDGNLDLAEAQHEIAENWIAAYKKYFHTDAPLKEHVGQDSP